MPTFAQLSEVLVPLFVAMSPLTVLPIYLNMTDGMSRSEGLTLGRRAVITALILAVSLVFVGQAMFRFLGITLDDLRVAGGVILLLIAIHDLIYDAEKRKRSSVGSDIGVVPLGTPLIVGPAAMTTCIVLADSHGRVAVLIGLLINLAIFSFILHFADRLKSVVNPSVSRAFGKVMSLFLAAIAIAMLRAGILGFIDAVV